MPELTERLFDGRSGAVSLTFDDGTTNQLDRAVPALDERGLRGTFYLNPRDKLMEEHIGHWRRISEKGHEIGNHTLSHPCPAAITGGRGLEDMTLGEVEADIIAARDRLRTIAPQQGQWSFAYPCYSTYVGRGLDRRSYVPVIARHFLAGRAGGELGFANHPRDLDLSALAGTPVERLESTEIIDLVRRLTGVGQWVILVFHDIDGGVLPIRRDDFLSVLDFLVEQRDAILTAPLVEIADRVARASKPRLSA